MFDKNIKRQKHFCAILLTDKQKIKFLTFLRFKNVEIIDANNMGGGGGPGGRERVASHVLPKKLGHKNAIKH
jgi:hypothetical protein